MNSPEIDKNLPQVYLKPGEFWIGCRPTIITTVLGSCISMTCFNPKTGFAAICHTLHPQCPTAYYCDGPCEFKYRYTACTVEAIAQSMAHYKQRPVDIEVKLFGGASIIGSRGRKMVAHSVGRSNVETAMEMIKKLNLPLKVANVGGHVGRKLIFDTATGHVHLKRLAGSFSGEHAN